MAVQAAARSYGNLSLNDIFGERKSSSRDNELTKDISGNFWNDYRFALPPGTDVSTIISIVCKLLSHLAKVLHIKDIFYHHFPFKRLVMLLYENFKAKIIKCNFKGLICDLIFVVRGKVSSIS